jgi:hypothetical protein
MEEDMVRRGRRGGPEGSFEECGAAVQCVVMLWPVMIE